MSEDRSHWWDLYDEELADADPAELAAVEAFLRGELTPVPTTPEEQERLIEEINACAADAPASVDDAIVVTTLRLPMWMSKAIEEFALAGNPKPAALMRRWIADGLARETGHPVEGDLDQVGQVSEESQEYGRRIHELVECRTAGEGISSDPGPGEPTLTTESATVDPELGDHARVPVELIRHIEAMAEARGSYWGQTLRRWINEGLARDTGEPVEGDLDLDVTLLAALDRIQFPRVTTQGQNDPEVIAEMEQAVANAPRTSTTGPRASCCSCPGA